MKSNIIKDKSKLFAIRIINLYKDLANNKREYVISKQILRAGTSIGANVNEALCSITKKEFLSKMYISYKEASETLYWIELLKDTNYINENEFCSSNNECKELIRLLSSITKSTRENINN
ncbi:MAG: four helix bundle protein [Bacteroidales bacterium]|nr:four helix bundle protein [Bacteroidales bacterium]